MNRILSIIRDPIWQAVGVLVSVIGIFITLSTPSPSQGELAIVRVETINFGAYLLPDTLLRLNLQKEQQSMEGALVDYYTLINKTQKPIVPSDYIIPLTVAAANENRILVVASCAKPNQGSSDLSCTSDLFVSSNWTQQGDSWVQERALLNPGEQFCVIVVRKPGAARGSIGVSWQSRIVGTRVSTYASQQQYGKSLEMRWYDVVQTSIHLEGFGAYWFALLQVAMFYATAILARQARWQGTRFGSAIWPVVVVMVLSTSTAEILVDIFLNENRSNQSPLIWPLLLAHLLVILYLLVRAIRTRTATP